MFALDLRKGVKSIIINVPFNIEDYEEIKRKFVGNGTMINALEIKRNDFKQALKRTKE